MRTAILITTVLFSTAAFAQAPARPKTPTDTDTLITADQFAAILANGPVAKDTGKPGSLSAQLFSGGVASCSFIRISEPDTPHAHGTTSEIYVIQQGEGSIETGGDMVGPFNGNSAVHTAFFVTPDGKALPAGGGQGGAPAAAATGDGAPAGARPAGGGGGGRNAAPGGPHDGAGTAVAGGRTQKVKPGDVILIPAGVPHHWVGVDKPLVYLDIKFPKGNGAGNGNGGGNQP